MSSSLDASQAAPASARPSAQGAPRSARRPLLGLAREGWPAVAIVAGALGAVALLGALLWPASLWATLPVLVVVAGWSVWFFRDPERTPACDPADASAVISPADGVVVEIGPAAPPPEMHVPADAASGMIRVGIFMNIFDVHVNRAPCAGTVRTAAYRHGAFLNASFDKASELNERAGTLLQLDDGRLVGVVQIAGLIARRIVRWTAPGERLARGERFGLIRFGSRVDVYLPPGSIPTIAMRTRVVAGRTVIARLAPGQEQRP